MLTELTVQLQKFQKQYGFLKDVVLLCPEHYEQFRKEIQPPEAKRPVESKLYTAQVEIGSPCFYCA